MKLSIGIVSCAFYFACGFSTTVHSQEDFASPQYTPISTASIQPNADEIMLEGIVEQISFEEKGKSGMLVLKASKFGIATKPMREIQPPKIKTVFFKSQSVTSPGKSLLLEIGARIQIVGPDKGTGTPIVARIVRVRPALIVDLKTTLGKDFTAFQKWIGEPTTSTNLKNGITRVYSSPTLIEKGVSSMTLVSSPLIPQSPKAVTSMKIVFEKGAELTWEQIIDFVGVSPLNITTGETKYSISVGNRVVAKYSGLHLVDISIPGVEMSKTLPTPQSPHIDKGFYLTWIGENPLESKATTLEINYSDG